MDPKYCPYISKRVEAIVPCHAVVTRSTDTSNVSQSEFRIFRKGETPVKTNQVSYKTRRSNEEGWDEFWYWAAICACWGFIAVVFLVGD